MHLMGYTVVFYQKDDAIAKVIIPSNVWGLAHLQSLDSHSASEVSLMDMGQSVNV